MSDKTKGKYKHSSVRLSAADRTAIKIIAAEEGLSMDEVFRRAVRAFIEEYDRHKARRRRVNGTSSVE